MKYDIYTPCDRLKPYVKHLAISVSDHARTYQVLPDTAIVIGFQYDGQLSYTRNEAQVKLAAAGMTGLLDSYRTFSNTAGTGTVLVVFKEYGAAHFIRTPLNELFKESVSLDNFFTQASVNSLQEKLQAAPTDAARIALVEYFLTDHLNAGKQDVLVAKALQYIHASKGTVRINNLAKALNTSQSPLEKRFRSQVGASPKKFAGIVRAQSMIQALNNGDLNLAEHLSSYYDQAHFIKDFKKYTSLTPEQYLRMIRLKK